MTEKKDAIESWTNGWNMPTETPFTGLVGNVAYAKPEFPPVVRAEDMLRECRRDQWQMGPHPILQQRGRDHG